MHFSELAAPLYGSSIEKYHSMDDKVNDMLSSMNSSNKLKTPQSKAHKSQVDYQHQNFKLVITPTVLRTKASNTQTPTAIVTNSRKIDRTTSPTLKRKADSHSELPKLSLRVVYLSNQPADSFTPLPLLSQSSLFVQPNVSKPLRPRLFKQRPIIPLIEHKKEIKTLDLNALQECEEIGKEFHNVEEVTDKKAFSMIKWALTTNFKLREEYNFIEVLGWGGCGAVLSAVRKMDGFKVAIKFIYKRLKTQVLHIPVHSDKASEMEILKMVSCAYIVKYIDHFEDSLLNYLIMENFGTSWRVDSSHAHNSLKSLLITPRRCHKCELSRRPCVNCEKLLIRIGQASCSSLYDFIEFHNQRIPAYLVPQIFKNIAESIAYLHSIGIIHGDIKEENILLGHVKKGKISGRHRGKVFKIDVQNITAKVCDFGHALRSKRSMRQMIRYGTKEVSAPELYPYLRTEDNHIEEEKIERFSGFEQDIWALGFLLYSMLFGNLPADIYDYISGKKEFKGAYYPIISEDSIEVDCLDCLKRMLCVDLRHRITADEILLHPWLSKRP